MTNPSATTTTTTTTKNVKNQKKKNTKGQKGKKKTVVKTITSKAKSHPRRHPQGFDHLSNYKLCVTRPFSDGAYGGRQPEPYAIPTVTQHFHFKINLGMAAGSSATSSTFVLLPGLFYTLIDVDSMNKNNANGLDVTDAGNMYPYPARTDMTNWPTQPLCWGMCNPSEVTALGAIFGNVRIVGMGAKVRVEMPELTRCGDLTIAPLAFGEELPPTDMMNYVPLVTTPTTSWFNPASAAAKAFCGGNTPASLASTSMLNLPGARTWSLNNLAFEDINLICKPTGPKYSQFEDIIAILSHNALMGNTRYGDAVIINDAGTPTFADMNSVQVCGMNGFVIRLDNFQKDPSTTTPVLSIEVIVHVEGTPIINVPQITQGIVPVPDTPFAHRVGRVLQNLALDFIDSIDTIYVARTLANNFGVVGSRGRRKGEL